MPDRCTSEYERFVAKMGVWFPYRRARTLLPEFLPLDDVPTVETTRQRTLHVGAKLEREAAVALTSVSPAEAGAITLSTDGGHVRWVRSYQMRSFEILLAQVSNDDGKQIVFSSMPAEADRQRDRLRGLLHGLGATPTMPVAILSDGADRPRLLGEAASVGPTQHVLDWFHLSMRIQHIAQAFKGWPDMAADDRQASAAFGETIERIRWRLWHGQVRRGLNLIGETLATPEATVETTSSATATARKVARLLVDLETYVSGQSSIMRRPPAMRGIDLNRDHRKRGAVVVAPPMNAQQQMRWSPKGAHLMLKVRTSVVNGTFYRDHAIAERWAYRPFRLAA